MRFLKAMWRPSLTGRAYCFNDFWAICLCKQSFTVFLTNNTELDLELEQLLPHLLASWRESTTVDLDSLCSAINLWILYGTEKRFKKMVQLSSNIFNTVLDVLSPLLNEGMSCNHKHWAKCFSKSTTWLFYYFALDWLFIISSCSNFWFIKTNGAEICASSSIALLHQLRPSSGRPDG